MITSHRYSTTWLLLAAIGLAFVMLVGCAEEPPPAPPVKEEAKTPPKPPAEAPPPAEPEPKAAEKPKPADTAKKSLTNPSALNEQAPDVYMVKFATSKGDVRIQITRAWAPNGADRFYNLVKNGFFDEARFFRYVPNFIVQFGMHADASISKIWGEARFKDDPVTRTNRKGSVTFATAGPNTRTSQVFINLKANAFLDSQGFAPFGRVVEGMEIVEGLYSGYGEAPEQGMIRNQGNKYLNSRFPKLDFIKAATIEE